MTKEGGELRLSYIFTFWVPLAATWLMMSVEGPLIAAIIARLPEAKNNLAAYGVAFSFALIVEAPIIMMMSASTALVHDGEGYRKLRNFLQVMNLGITSAMIILLIPDVFYWLIQDVVGLPPEVTRLTHIAVLLLLPWPGAIGYRRFYQGILIRNNLTKRVAYGTVLRLAAILGTSFSLFYLTELNGAAVGAISLSTAVIVESIATRIMAHSTIKRLRETPAVAGSESERMTYGSITSFYYPLALTSLLALGVHPMVTFFIGQSRMALESLAVLPVITSLVFIFRSMGLSFNEVGIALMGERFEGFRKLRTFTALLASAVVVVLGVIAFTPLEEVWFVHVSGLTQELAALASTPLQILVIIPGFSVLLSFQRSVLVNVRRTKYITLATGIEVGTIILILFVAITQFNAIGVVAAAVAFILGRFAANAYLMLPVTKAVKERLHSI